MTDENTEPKTAGTEPTGPIGCCLTEPMTCSNGSR